ncbi:hypothetical protein [Serratia fonticola]|uniref:hypothetical protein n=1 Tax=Serratia fonticola TaxID=47917 RepID=UPI003BB5C63A
MERRQLLKKILTFVGGSAVASTTLAKNQSQSSTELTPVSNLDESIGAENIGITTKAVGIDNLQQVIANTQWQFSTSILKNGGYNDKKTDNTKILQSIIDNIDSGYIVIEYGCKWKPSAIAFKNELIILDYSGYDEINDKWGGHIKIRSQTSRPDSKNAHELIYQAPYHPAVIVDNTDDSGFPGGKRCSVILRYKNSLEWRLGYGRLDTDKDLVIADKKLSGRILIAQTPGFEMAFNSAYISGVHYTFGTKGAMDQITQWIAPSGQSCMQEFFSGSSTQLAKITYASSGEIYYYQNGSQTLKLGSKGQMYGIRYQTTAVSSIVKASVEDSGSFYYNTSIISDVIVILPEPIAGLFYKGIVTKPHFLTFQTSTGRIRGYGDRIASNTISDNIEIICLIDGIWEVIKSGNWISS